MNIVSRLLRRVPKRFLPIGAALVAIAIPAAVMAWGPDRPTYTMAHPADHITFNSITNNSEVGDERNFLVIKDASNTNAGGWQDTVTAEAGHEYLVRMYVHNDAASNLNLVATNTRAKVNVPTTTGKEVQLGGFISADNATPQEIWDSAKLTSASDFNVVYQAGSARLYNNAFGQTGAQVSDSLVTSTGALLGYNQLDGKIPGCIEYSGYLTFKVKVQGPQQANYTFTKDVRKSGTTDKYAETVATNPGDKVDFRLSFKNTGDVKLDNVVLKDQLPAGLSYTAGTAKLYNSEYPSGYTLPDSFLTDTGANIGNYTTGINAFVVFTAQVAANDDLPTCGANQLHNIAKSETDHGNKEDSADVTTDKTCTTPPTPKYSCDALSVDKISRTQFKFTATKSVQNAEFKKFVFNVRDEQGNQIATSDSVDGAYSYTQDKPGKYSVQATVVVTVNGQEKTATSDNCKKQFEVTQPPVDNKYACDALQLIKKSRDTFDFTVKTSSQGNVKVKEYNFDFGDAKSMLVGLGQETQTHTYTAPGDYTAKVNVTFEVNGKTVSGVTSDTCAAKVTVEQPPVTPPTTPETPSKLPDTGAGLAVGGLFGSGAVGLGVNSWLGSRRKLRDSFKR
jgi:uncharacterized repeat protein (TIGR01451 family)